MSSDSEHDEDEIRGDGIDPKREESFLNDAARRCRMPPDRPTEHELAFFPEIWDCKTAVEVYILVRNTALATWLCNQWKECTAADVRQHLYPPFNSDLDFIQNIVHYLTRHGIINFGRYQRVIKVTKPIYREDRDVVVIGAGAAGISAATQLMSFGFNVIVLEARGRIGGRVHSIVTKNGEIMETGADMLRGLEDSPMATLLHQIQMDQHEAMDNLTVFVDGKPVDVKKDATISAVYSNTKGALEWQAHNREHRDENGRFISRQQAYENVMSLVERGTQIKYFNYCKTMEELTRAREHHYNQMKQLRLTAMLAEKRLSQMKQHEDPLLRRSLKRDIVTTMEKFEEVSQAFEVVDAHLIDLKSQPASKQYMQPSDFKNWNFMLGFEEYFYGAPLEKVQFSCNASENKKNGVVTRLSDGIAELLRAVAEKRNLDIRMKHRVRDIDYSDPNHVKLTVETEKGDVVEMKPAFVVSTLPIGVLKKTIVNDARAPTFTPPLPDAKVDAIRCLGSGLVNKCILQFDREFWAPSDRHHFVTISPDVKTRGSYLMWSAVPGSKVITTYLVGDAAIQSIPDDLIVQTAMSCLVSIFGNQCPRAPVHAHITRWQDDEFAFGSGSYMSLRTEMSHFEELIKPLEAPDVEAGPSTSTAAAAPAPERKPRVYFAGEHTCPTHTATVQGAWISGARAAADLANEVKGIGFVDLNMDANRKPKPGEVEAEFVEDVDGPMPMDSESPVVVVLGENKSNNF